MDKCPKCGAELNNDEKASGKCFSCGASFESSLPKSRVLKENKKNIVGTVLRYIGVIMIIIGVVNFIIYSVQTRSFHITGLFNNVYNGFIALGISEIIQLLYEKNKK